MFEKLYKSPQKTAYILILSLAIFSTIYNAYIPLHGDEAYYWMWSHHLQAGYYDHPPMIAYMIYLSNFISQNEWGVRLVNIVSMSVSALYIFRLTKEILNKKIALDALLIFSSVILVHAGFIITTTDAPLILFFSLTLFYSYKAFFYNSKTDYILAGIFLGFMMLSKYTAILFVFFLVLFILLKKRSILTNINFYIAAFIALIIVSPMVIWNYQHDWISFAFQLEYRGSKTGEIYPHLFFEFLGGQFGIFSPVFAAIFFFFIIKEKLFFKDEKLFFITLSSVVILLFFMYKSFFTRMELNFAAPAYVGAAIITAYIFDKYALKKTFKIGLLIALTFTIIGRFGFLFYLEIVQDRMYGNKQAVELLQKHVKQNDSFYGDHLTIASYLKYYLKGHPNSDIIVPSRFSQYDMWRKEDYVKDGLVLATNPIKPYLLKKYKNVEIVDSLTVQRGLDRTKTFTIYRVSSVK